MKKKKKTVLGRSAVTSSVQNGPLTFSEWRKLSFFPVFSDVILVVISGISTKNNLMTLKYNNLRSSADTLLVPEAPEKFTQSNNI